MRNLADHLLDVLENSVSAGAARVSVFMTLDEARCLTWTIRDDGHGPPGGDLSDPFLTTRRERRIGMGLALLRETAERSGGRLAIGPGRKGGTVLHFSTCLAHIDARPLGDLARAIIDALVCWREVDFRFAARGRDGRRRMLLDSAILRRGWMLDRLTVRAVRGELYRALRLKLEDAGFDTQFGEG